MPVNPFRRDKPEKATQEISKHGTLYELLKAFLDAYKERTAVFRIAAENGGNSDAIERLSNQIDRLSVEIGEVKNTTQLILGLLESPKPKPLEVKFVFKVANDHQDEPFSISIGGVTDAEGEPLPDTKGLTVDVKSSDDAVVAVSFDPSTNSGVASFGRSGVASLTASVTNAKGDILGSGAADFTVTTGDPAAVSDVKMAFGGLSEEPPAPDGGGGDTGGDTGGETGGGTAARRR